MTTREFDTTLLEVLACPCELHGELRQVDGALQCAACGRKFRIEDGIPVLLIPEAQAKAA